MNPCNWFYCSQVVNGCCPVAQLPGQPNSDGMNCMCSPYFYSSYRQKTRMKVMTVTKLLEEKAQKLVKSSPKNLCNIIT